MPTSVRWWWTLPLLFALGVPETGVAEEEAATKEDKPAEPARRKREPRRTRSGGPVSTPAPKRPAAVHRSPSEGRTERHRPSVRRPTHRVPAVSLRVAYERHASGHHRPAWQTTDSRFAHPAPRHVPAYWHAGHPAPRHNWYRTWYTHWWVHPYYRWVHPTHVLVALDFTPDPWVVGWAPPLRAGWEWTPGWWVGPRWAPGHWRPQTPAPAWYGVGWTWVPGWWLGRAYVDGYWRVERRADGEWEWVEGEYQEDGAYVPGHWRPVGAEPSGYTWEPGFWNGEEWVEGYWRPVARDGYHWVTAHLNEDGVFEAGYWEPDQDWPGMIWVPGWFDGVKWVPGYWVSDAEYEAADPDTWTPPEGVDAGWDEDPVDPPTAASEGVEVPLALPAAP